MRDPEKEIIAPADWAAIDFISDLHLQAENPATLAAWKAYMARTPASALIILGDLFEVWVGDDCLAPQAIAHADHGVAHTEPPTPSFAAECAAVIRATAQRMPVFIMAGNRDFLMGPALMEACQATALADPCTLIFGGSRWLLSHGDALCTDDLPYQAFRRQVRSSAWQSAFLARPLAERVAIAADIRSRSENTKRSTSHYIDLNPDACKQWLEMADAPQLIHGHTHQPGQHSLSAQQTRTVLSDWDFDARPHRGDLLRLHKHAPHGLQSARLERLAVQP